MTPEHASIILGYNTTVARQEIATTAKVLAAAPADRDDYAPSERCMCAGKLLWHIASAEVAILNGAASGAFDFSRERPADTETPAQISAWYKENATAALDRCAAMSGEDAAKIVDFMGVFQQPAVGFVTMAINHTIHHRGQLSAYLRPMGGKVPAIYGMSADDNPFEKKAAEA
jgi:uncharacterized damage-inducible protein DinB